MTEGSFRAHYASDLIRTITLINGIKVKSLRDAADLLIDQFYERKRAAFQPCVVGATQLLLAAATSGRMDDIARVTDEIERLLVKRRLLVVPGKSQYPSTT